MRGSYSICLLIGMLWLTVAETSGQGYVLFDNYEPERGVNAPVFWADGVTALYDPDYVAQIYAGPWGARRWTELTGVPVLASLGTGDPRYAGYWDAAEGPVAAIEGFDPGEQVTMVVMVWSTADGASLEDIIVNEPDSGVWFMGPFSVVLGSVDSPAPLVGLQSPSWAFPAWTLIPEPSTVQLAFAGLGVLAISCARRRSSIIDDQ